MIIRRSLLAGCAILLTLVTTAQQKLKMYEKEWKQVDSFIRKGGLTQSALKGVNTIYSQAKKEGNDVQIIKALLYQAQLQRYNYKAVKKHTLQMEAEIAASKQPAKALLQSITAQNYNTWFEQNRWLLYDRSRTVNFKKDDLATWSPEDFHQKIGELYQASLSNETLLQQIKLEPFYSIITEGNVRYLRPTLFDLLAHRALDYFRNNERDITKPADAFEISDAIAFADAKEFMKHTFTSTDSFSLQFKALQLYQRLLQFHAGDSIPDAFIDVDIARVVYVYNNATMENREALYVKALEQIGNKYGYIPPVTQAWYYLAQWYVSQAEDTEPVKNNTNRDAYIKAKSICDKVIVQKDSSEGRSNCQNLLQEITKIEMSLETEKVNLPGQPFRTLLNWRNVTQVHFRVVKMDEKTKNASDKSNWELAYWDNLLQLPAIRSYSQPLPDIRDYYTHAAELKIDALPVGSYALIASVNSDFSFTQNNLAVQYFSVSNIGYIHKGNELFVANRETGKPISHAKVQVRFRTYDNTTGNYITKKGPTVVTNENGFVKLTTPPGNDNNREFNIEISTGDDHLYLDEYLYAGPFTNTNEENKKTEKAYNTQNAWLFTDRTIYRPAQTVYFKGIVTCYNSKTRESGVVSRFTTSIVLKHFNGQLIDSLRVTTNEFGAYSGKFTLPADVLTGQLIISDTYDHDDVYFSVEEYKRPKFQVEINKPAGTYVLNEDITVKGTAKAFAGHVIDGATVNYRVIRKTAMPFWLSRFGKTIWPPNDENEKEIAYGKLTTDATGTFEIKFKAIPDNRIAKKDQPTFYYTVSADVTDAAGETRSTNMQMAVAYQALKLNLNLPVKLHTDSLKRIAVTSTNQNDLFEKTSVTLSIHKLKTPDRIFRDRYWDQPDTFVLSQTEYYSLFPYDVYKDENNPEKWAREQKVWEKTDSASDNKPFIIKNATFTPGWYFVEAATKDKYGEEVKDIQYVRLYNQSSVSPLTSTFIKSEKYTLDPGEKAVYEVNTTLDEAFIIHDVIREDQKPNRSFFTLNQASHSFEIPLTEKDRDGFGIEIAFIKHNRVYTDNVMFMIANNKELNIAYETFRDKTQPGSEEKWKVKINRFKGDKVAAEMLTAMYDASLDQFEEHKWNTPSPWAYLFMEDKWEDANNFFSAKSTDLSRDLPTYEYFKVYDELYIDREIFHLRESRKSEEIAIEPGPHPILRRVSDRDAARIGKATTIKMPDLKNDPDGSKGLMIDQVTATDASEVEAELQVTKPFVHHNPVQIRRNLSETAFFFPHLQTDADGNIEFSFTMPEAVTQWKWMSLAHTRDLKFGYNEKTIVTQKDLMVQPNAPRFLREGDCMNFSAKIANLTDKEMTGQVQLQLIDATTNQPVDGWFKNVMPNRSFTAPAKQSVPVTFSIEIPYQYNKPVTYRLVAKAGAMSDGEEAMLPVVSNRMLVTESLPLPVRGNTTKNFTFEKLVKSGGSETLNHHALTVEYTSNPAWYAVQALPYLMEYPYECAEQIFNRVYANALASTIANASPQIKKVFEKWASPTGGGLEGAAALLSNLQKNEELKSVLLQETPWVLQAKNEAQQKKNIALLFDLVRMSSELNKWSHKLQELQSSNGGFVWFKGGADDRYITQYILTGIGHLKKLKALPKNDMLNEIIKKAIPYVDARMIEDYQEILKRKTKQPQDDYISPLHIQYLYMRSFFPEYVKTDKVAKAYTYYRSQSQKGWLKQSRYMQGMIALSLFRSGDVQTAKNIVRSLKENAITNEEIGMYWQEFSGGYYWYQRPIEAQSLLMETFSEVAADITAVNDMKLWLLKQKQTHDWKTTKATADACYALLLQGTDLLVNTPEVTINLGNTTISSKDQKQEAGTGYFKKVFDEKQVKPEMGNIRVTVSNTTSLPTGREGRGEASAAAASWGAVYWQYFENLDKITPAATPLQLSKKLFIEKNTDHGPVLQPINEGDAIKVGDKVKVRIELRVDHPMEYVHMKDMRAACMEPVNVMSEYKWQGGLGYYESTRDASTNFFFSGLPQGTYVFEYPLFVTHTGTFSNGITTIQCMYAPEFTSHSEGVSVKVE
jgi:uncharacterized protein YfaS (alpha-2-macroglobulin family)